MVFSHESVLTFSFFSFTSKSFAISAVLASFTFLASISLGEHNAHLLYIFRLLFASPEFDYASFLLSRQYLLDFASDVCYPPTWLRVLGFADRLSWDSTWCFLLSLYWLCRSLVSPHFFCCLSCLVGLESGEHNAHLLYLSRLLFVSPEFDYALFLPYRQYLLYFAL